MKITYIPQQTDQQVSYEFDGERVVATVGDTAEEYDFTELPDGELWPLPPTNLPFRVLFGACRTEGQLHVTLLRTIPPRPQHQPGQPLPEYEAAVNDWLKLWTDLEEVRP